MLERIFRTEVHTIPEKKDLLLKNGIAIWDSIASCRIEGSSDASIIDALPNDIPALLSETRIERIIANGRKAYEIYRKYIFPITGIDAPCLPSTSPANAAWTLEKLIDKWRMPLTSN